MRKGFSIIFLSFLMIISSILKGDMSAAHRLGETLGKETKVDFEPAHLDKKFIPGYPEDKERGDRPLESAFADRPFTEIEQAGTDKLWASPEKSAGYFVITSKKTKQKIEIEPSADPLFAHANSIIAKPSESLKTSLVEEREEDPVREIHKCYEAAEPIVHKCIMKRTVKLRPIEEKKHLITVTGHGHGFWYRNKGSQHWGHDYIPSISAFDLELTKSHSHSFIKIDSALPFPKELAATMKRSILVVGSIQMNSDYNISPPNPSGHCGPFSGSVEIVYKPNPTEADLIETIDDSCAPLEKLTEEGMCRYGIETIPEGAATKELEEIRITRDWWHKERTYICGYDSKNDCEKFRAKGCVQTGSKCNVERDGNCLEYEQTYACVKYPSKSRKVSADGKAPFCLTGDCTDQSLSPNEDMAEVLSKLSLLNELQRDINAAYRAGEKSVINIFRGTPFSCSKHCASFSDCCGLKSGWGEQLRLTKCLPEEKLLSQLRGAGKCHQVGDEYCAEKGPFSIGCIRKKTTFCCFESKLARAVQQQARRQLGIGWGSPQAPDCRPLSIHEFSRVDFKRIDFSEIFSDVMSRVKVPDANKMATQLKEDWMKRLPTPEELGGKKLAEPHHMKERILARRDEVKAWPAGAYGLHGTPPYQKDAEEDEAKVVL